MSISILSDLHIDFYLHQKDPQRIKPKDVERVFEDYLDTDPEVEVLVCAGDLGHHNAQSFRVLELIASIFNYKKIFVVAGNHDRYSTSKLTMQRRIKFWQEYEDPKGIIHILDGTVIEYKGIRFGGVGMWYDGTYLKTLGSSLPLIDFWKYTMNDSKYCHMHDFMPHFLEEQKKAFSIQKECDVFITHMNPSISFDNQLPKYAKEASTAFYNWNGEKFLEGTTAQYVIYGHSHGAFNYTHSSGVKCYMNTMGYPSEPATWCTIDLEVETDEPT